MKCKLTPAISLVLILTLATSFYVQAQAQYSLDLEGVTWDHSIISVLVVPQDSATWWNPSHLNATLRSISQWNNAIQDFALNFTNSAYLSGLRMVPTVSHTMSYGYDIYVSWIQAFSNDLEEVGLTETIYTSSGIIMNSTISLAAEDSRGSVLNNVDLQNVALHELGHSFGLVHSNYSGDLMYPRLTPTQTVGALSTLDLYGVSTVFQWMSDSPDHPYNPQESSVISPSSIQYQYLPISYEDLPPPALPSNPSPILPSSPPQTLFAYAQALLTYILHFFLDPLILISILVGIAGLLFIEFEVARVTRKKVRKGS